MTRARVEFGLLLALFLVGFYVEFDAVRRLA